MFRLFMFLSVGSFALSISVSERLRNIPAVKLPWAVPSDFQQRIRNDSILTENPTRLHRGGYGIAGVFSVIKGKNQRFYYNAFPGEISGLFSCRNKELTQKGGIEILIRSCLLFGNYHTHNSKIYAILCACRSRRF